MAILPPYGLTESTHAQQPLQAAAAPASYPSTGNGAIAAATPESASAPSVFPFTALPLDQLGEWYRPADLPFVREVIPPEAWPSTAAHSGLDWPPGKAGVLARFFVSTAHRPVREVAVVAALGWLAGVCGKAFNTPSRSGLNLYVILVARSAVGKEAMHSAITILMRTLGESKILADDFVSFDRFKSGPALRKEIARHPSFVNVTGEWGLTLKAMLSSERQPEGPLSTLRAEMTDLYQKSGPDSTAGTNRYSDPKNNVERVGSVAYSMIGETTPETFRASLTGTMMEDGFASRFSVVEYLGDRPPENKRRVTTPPTDLVEWCGELVRHALELLAHNTGRMCIYSDEAMQLREAFNDESDKAINSSNDNSVRQVWNRADLKAQKIACLLAAADSPSQPVVYLPHMQWAINLVRRDIQLYQKQLSSGDIGDDDAAREKKILLVLKEYLTTTPKGYQIPDAMHHAGVVPRRYLQQRTNTLPLFAKHRLGATPAFDMTIRSLCDNGYLFEVDKMKAGDAYGYHGRCYRVTNLMGGLLD